MSQHLPYAGQGMSSFVAEPGALVVRRNWKWNGYPHWVHLARYVRQDEYGHWLYEAPGEFISRPGFAFFSRYPAIMLIPHQGDWAATFHPPQREDGRRYYIDLVTEIFWRPLQWAREDIPSWEINMVDMDLDVVKRLGPEYPHGEHVFLDDEDEFAEHRELFGYPDQLSEHIQHAAQDLLQHVRKGTAPFDGTDVEIFNLMGKN